MQGEGRERFWISTFCYLNILSCNKQWLLQAKFKPLLSINLLNANPASFKHSRPEVATTLFQN